MCCMYETLYTCRLYPYHLRFLGKENVCLKMFVNINVHVFLGGCRGASDAGAILRERPGTVHPQYAIVVIHCMVALPVEYVHLAKRCTLVTSLHGYITNTAVV